MKDEDTKSNQRANDYDWTAWKMEFIVNEEYVNASTWLINKKNFDKSKVKNGNVLEKIKGWARERQDLLEKQLGDRMKQIRETEKKRRPDLVRAKMNIVAEVTNRLARAGKKAMIDGKEVIISELDTEELNAIYKIVKVELGEPTIVTKNENRTLDIDEDEETEKELEEALNEIIAEETTPTV